MDNKLWHKSYAPGVKKTLDYEKVTISEALTRSAKDFPNNVALGYMGKKITYRELDSLVNRFLYLCGNLVALAVDQRRSHAFQISH